MIDSTPIHELDENTWQTVVQKAMHDVRNLLATLQGYSEIALHSTGKDTFHLIDKIAREGLKVTRETDIFFDFLTLRSHTLSLSLETCLLSEMLTSIDAWLHVQFPQKTFLLQKPPPLTECIVDKRLFSSAVLALSICCIENLSSGDSLVYGAEEKNTHLDFFFKPSHGIKGTSSFLFYYAFDIFRLHHIHITDKTNREKELRFTL